MRQREGRRAHWPRSQPFEAGERMGGGIPSILHTPESMTVRYCLIVSVMKLSGGISTE